MSIMYVGRKVVDISLNKGYKVNAITRNGTFTGTFTGSQAKNLFNIKADITSTSDSLQLSNAIKGSSAVIFAASASKEGGNPAQVDRDGLIKVAKACIENKIPRLVIVSSGAVTKPFSPVYLFLNLFGGIMKAKIDGENAVRNLYVNVPDQSIGYTVIRPGGLTEDPPKGCEFIELNQGDDKSGRISRWDVAQVCVESIQSKDANRATFEAYYVDTAQPLANVGFSNIFKRTNEKDKIRSTGRERTGKTFPQLFKGLASDF